VDTKVSRGQTLFNYSVKKHNKNFLRNVQAISRISISTLIKEKTYKKWDKN